MIDVSIRPATETDSEFAYQTKKAAFREYVDLVSGWDDTEQRQLHTRRFATQEFHIVQESGIDVGVLAIAQEPRCLRVNQLFVLPQHQRQGIGKACVTQVIEDAARQGLPVQLKVLRANPRAVAFYHRLGFRTISVDDTHIAMERPLVNARRRR